jgi:hypothetical protein
VEDEGSGEKGRVGDEERVGGLAAALEIIFGEPAWVTRESFG